MTATIETIAVSDFHSLLNSEIKGVKIFFEAIQQLYKSHRIANHVGLAIRQIFYDKANASHADHARFQIHKDSDNLPAISVYVDQPKGQVLIGELLIECDVKGIIQKVESVIVYREDVDFEMTISPIEIKLIPP